MDKPKNKQVDEFAKLSWGERIAYGAGDLAQNLIFGTIGSMLLFYLTTVFWNLGSRWGHDFSDRSLG